MLDIAFSDNGGATVAYTHKRTVCAAGRCQRDADVTLAGAGRYDGDYCCKCFVQLLTGGGGEWYRVGA